jgi:hypothetical protein
MARLEADAIRRGGERFMNQYLVPLVPRRTLDAVKGKRRTLDYRRLVQEILKEPAMNLRGPHHPKEEERRILTVANFRGGTMRKQLTFLP